MMYRAYTAVLVFSCANAAVAQPSPPPPNVGWSFVVGGGGIVAPDYQGSDDYEVRALPFLSAKYEDWLTIAFPEGVKAAIVSEGGLKLGVAAGFGFGRDEGDNAALVGLGDIDPAVELGIFAEYRVGPVVFGLDARRDVAGAHDGTVAKFSARVMIPAGGVRFGIGPQITWTDDNYTQTYFGITPEQAATSAQGYAPYAADGGIKDFGLTAMAMIPVAENWTLTAMAGVSQLTGDAADSPLVAAKGSETQFTVGVFAGYKL